MTIDEWKEKQEMNKDLCDWFKGLAPEEKKAFWKQSPEQAEQSRKAMDAEIMNASMSAISVASSKSKTMTRDEFEALERSSPQEAMDFCLNGGEITE